MANYNPPTNGFDGSKPGPGRPKGSKNKTSAEIKEAIKQIVAGQLDYIEEALERVRQRQPEKYCQLVHKFAELTIPRQQAIELTNTPTIDVEASIQMMKDELKKNLKSDE